MRRGREATVRKRLRVGIAALLGVRHLGDGGTARHSHGGSRSARAGPACGTVPSQEGGPPGRLASADASWRTKGWAARAVRASSTSSGTDSCCASARSRIICHIKHLQNTKILCVIGASRAETCCILLAATRKSSISNSLLRAVCIS